jgi:hypothetical protein
MHRIIVLGLLFLFGQPTGLMAQEMPQLRPDARVRITAPMVAANPIVGTVVSVDARNLVLRRTDRNWLSQVPLVSIKRLEVSQGRQSSGKRALKGAGLGMLCGGAVGMLTGILAAASYDNHDSGDIGLPSNKLFVLIFSPSLGAGVGLIGGTIWGALPRERWSAVSMPSIRQGLGPGQSGPFMLAMTVRF